MHARLVRTIIGEDSAVGGGGGASHGGGRIGRDRRGLSLRIGKYRVSV